MAILFISDLHIDAQRPEITRQFVDFLKNEARGADALYILGDLFESWVGDDAPDRGQREAIAAIRSLTAGGRALLRHARQSGFPAGHAVLLTIGRAAAARSR